MTNIEDMFKTQTPKPNRELSSTFTDQIVNHITVYPQEYPQNQYLRRVMRWVRRNVGIVSLLGLLLVGGTAAAAVTTLRTVSPTPKPQQTPLPNVNQTVTKQLSDGNRVVGYNLQSCHFFSSPTYVDTQPSENIFYEVKQGSTLTNEQLQASLEGVCESMVNSDNMSAISKAFQHEDITPYDGFSTLNMVVENITPTSITVRIDPAYTVVPIAEQDKLGLTYTQFYQGLKVYNENTPITYSDIKAGDTVQLLMGHTPGYTYTEGVAQEVTPNQDILYAIMKVPPLAADPTLFYLSVGQDLQQVKPCSTDSSGYCPVSAQPSSDN